MSTSAHGTPRHRTILAVDVEGSTDRNNTGRAELRDVLYDVVDRACLAGGIRQAYRDKFVDRGDGLLCLVRPLDQVPKPVLLATVVPALSRLVADHNARKPESAFRLRVAVHAGEVHSDPRGLYGEDVDIACRLVDAPELKRFLRESSGPVVLVVSQEIHRSVVRHGYPGIDQRAFTQAVHAKLGAERLRGWLHHPAAAQPGEELTA
ncbi:hypothetical protein M8542_11260 [Amycolatopsis sp. OK19-0408]|uniref:Guanylate cyclase domain-containing protein n=1 Tax=Amycolatopsis iheyensis TaxID=2945988 RepID=A0A9X2SI49_9PSEU|nr:hypothetical protein [Amycolatopsis iheyensis]MCR6483397.1 hypothetical protein [Amycolatopsis iheyensis]